MTAQIARCKVQVLLKFIYLPLLVVCGLPGCEEASPPSASLSVMTTDKEELHGDWRAVDVQTDGQDNNDGKDSLFTFSGNLLTIQHERLGQEVTAEFALDETTDPKQITWSGEFNGKTFVVYAIYELNNNELRYCATQQLDPSEPVPPRPTESSTTEGDSRTLSLLTRVSNQTSEH